MKTILICGQMYSGKDYFARKLADYLMDKGHSVIKTAFAWKLKDYIKTHLGVTKTEFLDVPHDLEKDFGRLKTAVALDYFHMYGVWPNIKDPDCYDSIKESYESLIEENEKNDTSKFGLHIRNILQKFGTEVVRDNYSKTFWVDFVSDYATKATGKADFMIVSDYRFAEEALSNAYKIRINASIETREKRSGINQAKLIELNMHESEINVPNLPVEYVIENNIDNNNFLSHIEYIYKDIK